MISICRARAVFLRAFLFLTLAAPMLRGQDAPSILWQASANSDRVNTMNFTPDGRTLISGSSDRLINVWDAASGELEQVLDSKAPNVHASSIECLAINPANPDQIATVSSNIEHLWNLSSGKETDLSPRPQNWMVWCAFSPDGQWLATASFNSTIRVWSVSGDSASLAKTFPSGELQRTCAFSPDGRWLASAGGDRAVTIRDTSDWSTVAVLTGHTNDIYDLVFSPDGTMLATGGYDNTARLWSVGGWTNLAVLGGDGPVYGVAFSPDSRTLAYTDGEGDHLLLADTRSFQILQTWDTSDVQCVAFSSQGLLAFGDVDETVFVTDLSWLINPVLSPPLLSAVGYTSEGFEISLATPATGSCAIQVSSDLVNWSTVGNVASTGGVVNWTDPGATNSGARFYRVVASPE